MTNVKEKILQVAKGLQTEYFTLKQLCAALGTTSSNDRHIVADLVATLAEQGELIFDQRNRRYSVVDERYFGKAVFDANPRGFGFLIMDEGEDLFVPANKTHGAFHRDTVLFRRVPGTTDEAEIVKIVSRGCTQIVGTYDTTNNTRFVLPDDKKFASDVYVAPKKHLGAKHGQKVVVKINVFPQDNRNNPEGEIVQVLGYPNDKNVDMLSVAYAFGLATEFPQQVALRAQKVPQQVGADDFAGRRDLRKETIFTIDGEDAKDLDDAVSIAENANGTFTLGVHIADVSHYVKPATDIDNEAFARGTSVYFPQMVLPMLPTTLSNGICSLFCGVDRLALSCVMTVDGNGKVLDSDLFSSVINSKRRLTYTNVQALFDGDAKAKTDLADVADSLFAMQKLAKILQNKRNKRGNIDFATKEVTFVQDEKGNVVDVVPFERLFAHQLIEEFMILANETVAEYAAACAYPFVYRVHDKPDEEKLSVLFALMKGVGINVKNTKEVHNSILQNALQQAKSTPYFHLINDVMLRTMQKAKYSDTNNGHFGLASRCYCHFTSPIRRYPDLVAHRILKTAVVGKMTHKALAAYEQMASDCARQANVREKLADEAERKADDVKKCNYATRIIGQTFEAIISGVTERGIFAQLANTVEGFVAVDKLAPRLTYNKQQFCLFNDAVRYALGDKITVKVACVNKQACKIDFDLA